MGKLPSTQWYFADWLRDPALRGVSLAARGLWADMLAILWESPERGVSPYPGLKELKLRSANAARKVEAKAWAKVAGGRADFVEKLLRDLELLQVFSRRESDGRIYSRRLVREELERKRWRESKQRHSTRFPGDFPPLSRDDQGGHSTEVPGALSSSSSSSNLTTTPLPPVNGGTKTHDELLKDENNYSYMGWNGGHIIIRTGRHKRVLRQRDVEGLAGARIEQVVELIRRRGFWAEIYVPTNAGKNPE